MKAEALKIKAREDLDAIVSTTDGIVVGSLLVKSLRDIAVALPVFSVTVDQAAIDVAKGAFEGMEFLSSLTPQPEFKSEYESRYKVPIDIGADSAYDAVMMIAQAMRETSSTDPTLLARKLSDITEYQGVSGRLISDGERGIKKAYAIK